MIFSNKNGTFKIIPLKNKYYKEDDDKTHNKIDRDVTTVFREIKNIDNDIPTISYKPKQTDNCNWFTVPIVIPRWKLLLILVLVSVLVGLLNDYI